MDQTPETPAASNSANHDTPDHGSNNDKAKRKRQPRNSACQGCALMKMKCVPSSEPGKCERCHRMDRDCLPTVPKPRKRRNPSTGGGESPQEVSLPTVSEPAMRPPKTPTNPTYRNPLESIRPDKEALLNKHDLTHTDSESFRILLVSGLGVAENHSVLLRGLDYNRVQNSLLVFRQFTEHFPFAAIRRDADGVNMATSRPATTLTICAIAAGAQPELQSRLLQALQLAFSHHVLHQGKLTVDLANAMLLHLAWRHHYMQNAHVYPELSLLAGVVSDLGFYDRLSEAEDTTVEAEKDLLFLGSYYICCSLSLLTFGRPSPLRWTDHLRHRAQRSAYHSAMRDPRILISLIELIHITEDLMDDTRTTTDLRPDVLAASTELHSRAILNRLRALKREYPELAGRLCFTAATLHVHRRSLSMSTSPDTTLIIQCAVMIKEYVDDLLARPAAVLHQVPISDWTSLLDMFVMMASFSKPPTHSTGWEAGALTSMLQPEVVLESVTKHMASVPANDPLSPRNDALLNNFRQHCEDVKRRIDFERTGVASLHIPSETAIGSLGQFRAVNQPLAAMPSASTNGQPVLPRDRGNVLDDRFWSELRSGR